MISGEVVLLIVVTLINISLWVVFFLRVRRFFSSQSLTDIKIEAEKIIKEIDKTTLDDITLIEQQKNELQILVEKADKKILLLQEQVNNRKREQDVLNRLSQKKTMQPTEKKVVESYKKMSDSLHGDDTTDAVQLSIDFDAYNASEEREAHSTSDTIPEIIHHEHVTQGKLTFNEKVLQLAASDFSADYIAQKLDCTVSEVQLVIDLYSF